MKEYPLSDFHRDHKIKGIMKHLNQVRFFPFFCSIHCYTWICHRNQPTVGKSTMTCLLCNWVYWVFDVRCSLKIHGPEIWDELPFCFKGRYMGLNSATCCQRIWFSINGFNGSCWSITQMRIRKHTRVNTQDQRCFFWGAEKNSMFQLSMFLFMFVHP